MLFKTKFNIGDNVVYFFTDDNDNKIKITGTIYHIVINQNENNKIKIEYMIKAGILTYIAEENDLKSITHRNKNKSVFDI